jgi:hypothetical protein
VHERLLLIGVKFAANFTVKTEPVPVLAYRIRLHDVEDKIDLVNARPCLHAVDCVVLQVGATLTSKEGR